MNTEPTNDYKKFPVNDIIKQSPPIDVQAPYEASWVKGKTILITGGASGFGEGFARRFAANGATVIIGDISAEAGSRVTSEIKKETGNPNVYFIYLNVCDWQSQVNYFKEAIKLSPHGGIDCVVPNAGVAGIDDFEEPQNRLDGDTPPKPNFRTMEVNLTGVLYTVHLAMFYLPRNPGSKNSSISTHPADMPRDRCLLLMGSMASLYPIPGQALYAASKHGVMGLFRTIRSTSFAHGIRVNIICPYFIDTPILPAPARALLAGGGLGKAEDVVEGGVRVVADTRIMGRSLYIGPKMKVEQDERGEWQLSIKRDAQVKAIWDAYAHDYDDSELFGKNLVRLLNAFTKLRGWAGYFADLFRAFILGVRKPMNLLGRRTAK